VSLERWRREDVIDVAGNFRAITEMDGEVLQASRPATRDAADVDAQPDIERAVAVDRSVDVAVWVAIATEDALAAGPRRHTVEGDQALVTSADGRGRGCDRQDEVHDPGGQHTAHACSDDPIPPPTGGGQYGRCELRNRTGIAGHSPH